MIVGLLERQTWQSRELKPGIVYQYPPLETDIFKIDQKQAEKKITESSKEKVVVAIATELGIGGTYAEEVCFRAGIEKNTPPTKLTKTQRAALWSAIKDILTEIKKPEGYIYETGIAPIVLQTFQLREKLPTFNEALEKVLSTSKQDQEKLRKESQFRQRIASLQHIESEQQQKLHDCEERTEEETKKAEWIYDHYKEIKQLLSLVEKSRASGGWQAVTETLKKMKKIKSIDLKEKKITVEF
jgi:predicted ribosome quality control (RQC) complex YloA/Tae2 family protein